MGGPPSIIPGSVVVVIPTLNEEAAIAEVVLSIPRAIVSHVIVADGGSTDGTAAQAQGAGAQVVAAAPGYGSACFAATLAAETADIVVFMDGDGADDPTWIPALVDPILSGEYDFVIGSRVRGVRESGSMAWHQIVAGLMAGLAIRILYGARYTDMCAFRAIRRDSLLALGMRELTYGWNLEMQMRAARAGLRILEVPTSSRRRIGGVSKVSGSLRGTLRAGTRIIATFVRVAALGVVINNPRWYLAGRRRLGRALQCKKINNKNGADMHSSTILTTRRSRSMARSVQRRFRF
jgi:glycosyltransferase involved in cell wall biosynthesis